MTSTKGANFKLNILRQHWINDDGKVDNNDLCSHGEIFLSIGTKEVSNSKSGSWCLSAAGLFLLRTLKSDYTLGEFDNFLIPCCGHMMFYNADTSQLDILGCNSGIDFSVLHKNNSIELITENNKVIVSLHHYKTEVLKFVTEVEEFYGNPKNKIIPKEDDYLKQSFQEFWKEWNELKSIFTSSSF